MADTRERHGSTGRGKNPRGQREAAPASSAGPASGASDSGQSAAAGYRGAVPAQLPAPGRQPWTYVERQEHLANVAAALAGSEVIALDAEFVQVRARGPDDPPHRLALLQVAAMPGEPGAYVIDALRLPDLGAIGASLENPGILKLFHGIGADARVLRTRHLEAQHTLDLEAVSRSIFGQRESGLQAMLLRACGVRLDKSLQRSDWTRRPLTPAMLGYAARDAEMTLLLYSWLRVHYPWAIALHETPAHEPPPTVAPWILPFLDGPRPQRAEWAVAAAGLEGQRERQADDLRAALAGVRHPPQRARVLRLISDLELSELAPDLLLVLDSPASEERAGAARALGRLRARSAEPRLRSLLADATEDVREAAQAALEMLRGASASPPRVPRPNPAGGWTVGGPDDGTEQPAAWQTLLRARFQPQGDGDAPPARPDGDDFTSSE